MRNLRNQTRQFFRSAFFWDITQRIMIIPYWRFGRKTYRSYIQGSLTPSWPLKMEPVGCPETSARTYHRALRNNPEQRNSHLLRGGSLKSRKIILLPYKCGPIFFFTGHHDYSRLRQDPAQRTTDQFEDLKCLMTIANCWICGSENWTNTIDRR